LNEVLGTAGLMPPQFAKTGTLPPPGQLKRKVLLKGKMRSAEKEAVIEEEEDDEEEEEPETPNNKRGTSPPVKKGKEEEKKKPEKKKKSHGEVAQELSDLIHLRAVGFPGFDQYKSKNKPWEMSSFVESKVSKFIGKTATDYVEYNRLQISRIYPKGLRVDSSNYDPTPSWSVGAQIVALNYQTGTEPMWTNDGKFMDNGGCGYILKPSYMLDEKVKFDPSEKKKTTKNLELIIISGWQLPKVAGKETKSKGEVIDPYVKVSINGVPLDRRAVQTKVIKNNGFNPVWSSTFKVPIVNEDLLTLTFAVSDSDLVSKDDFIGQYSLSLSCVRQGYRVVPLKDSHGTPYTNSSLFIFTKLA